MGMVESSSKGYKTPWEKEKLLVDGKFFKRVESAVGKEKLLMTRNFSFPRSFFQQLIQQTRKNKGLFRKGLDKNLKIPTDIGIEGEPRKVALITYRNYKAKLTPITSPI